MEGDVSGDVSEPSQTSMDPGNDTPIHKHRTSDATENQDGNGHTSAHGNSHSGSGDLSVRPRVFLPADPNIPGTDDLDNLAADVTDLLKIDLTGMEGSYSSSDSSITESTDLVSRAHVKEGMQHDPTVAKDYGKEDIELTFTNLYCYSNLLESISDSNDSDHFRFLKFLQQVEHKQSELIRVSEALPECANLAIDLAYNFVVTMSYMNLMFTWDTGKQVLAEEISELMMRSTSHVLSLAHRTRDELVSGCEEELIAVMQKFCLVTVVDQASKLPNLSQTQMTVLAKLEKIIARSDGDPNTSLSSLDLDLSSEDSDLEDAVKQAQDFGHDSYKSAIGVRGGGSGKSSPAQSNKETLMDRANLLNRNNNADHPELSESESDADHTDQASAAPPVSHQKKTKAADVDDIILFTKVNPFTNIWKLYIDNSELVALFKINNSFRSSCLDNLPDCFTILRCLENIGFSIISNSISEEDVLVNESFQLLQHIIGLPSLNGDDRRILHDIVQEFSDVEVRLASLFDCCEVAISKAITDIKSSSSTASSDGTESSDSDGGS